MNPDSTTPNPEYFVDSDELAALIHALVDDGHTISLNAPGGSMMPFIRSGDKIYISPVDTNTIRSGDILVFLRRSDERVIAHRVVKTGSGCFLGKGDNVAEQNDGWVLFEDVLGRVERVRREEKSVWLGVSVANKLIAWLSRKNILVWLINFLRSVKWGLIGLFRSAVEK